MSAMPPRVINDPTLHSSSQTRVSASLITARCEPESRGQDPSHLIPGSGNSDWSWEPLTWSGGADICQEWAICSCVYQWSDWTMAPVTRCQAQRLLVIGQKDVIQLRGTDAWLDWPGEEERAICWYFIIMIFNWDTGHTRDYPGTLLTSGRAPARGGELVSVTA